jgi:hypothetical protein
MLQDIITYIIGSLTAIWLCYKLYRFFLRKQPLNKCEGCAGCEFKNLLEQLPREQ